MLTSSHVLDEILGGRRSRKQLLVQCKRPFKYAIRLKLTIQSDKILPLPIFD